MERRQGSHLSFQPDQGVLVVGGRTAVLDDAPPADVVVSTYVDLVVSQRAITPCSRRDLRDEELLALAALLELPSGELDELIDRELERLLTAPAPAKGRTRRTLAFGALAIVAVAAAIATAATAGGADNSPATVQPDGTTVEVVTLPDGSTATRTESAPAPQTEDGVDIGTAVQYER